MIIRNSFLHFSMIRDPGQLIYSHFPLESMGQGMGLSEEIYQSLTERDYFCHVHYLDLDLDSILLTTTRHHILLDRRLPGRYILLGIIMYRSKILPVITLDYKNSNLDAQPDE